MNIANKSFDNQTKIKILIAGIGGVGGFFGGLLAKEFYQNDAIEIYFLARGKNLEVIKTHGLQVKQGENTFIAHPKLASDKVSEIGTVDHIILCTKTYDLEKICNQIKPCLTAKTIILPLLNGVNNSEIIKTIFPNNIVLIGCVYIVSKIAEPGKIENTGNIQSLYFGLDKLVDERFKLLETIFKQANIEVTLSSSISTIIWEKYIFLSAIATATSYFDCSIGEILENNEKKSALKELVNEVVQVALSHKLVMSNNITEKTFQKFSSLPSHITSSMHRDFKSKKSKTELETLTRYVVNESFKKHLESPFFNEMYSTLKTKINGK